MKLAKSVLVSPARLRAIADRLERQATADANELRRLADMAEGLARVNAKAAAKPKTKAKKAKTAKKAVKAAKPAKRRASVKAAKKTVRRGR